MKLLLVAGARPNFMKIAPLIHKLQSSSLIESRLVHTGQHYDYEMSGAFFNDLEIPKPNYFLNVGSGSHAVQTANIMIEFEKVCLSYKPNMIVVVGDVNSTVACSIVAKKMNISVIHIEAGLRSFDREMPEEINRILTDSITDYFFVTEESGMKNLINEGINKENIFHCGNLMIDTLYYGLSKISERDKFSKNDYGVITLHRPSNVDDKLVLENLLVDLNKVSEEIALYFPIHPRTKKAIDGFNLTSKLSDNIKLLPPQSYLDFIHLVRDCKVVFTDSGGIQEESTVLKIPCYTLRNNTERPITVLKGTNILVGNKKSSLIASYNKNRLTINSKYQKPAYWDGKAADRIIKIIEGI
tara:strand:- start:365 stop:1432 length:1068 start_codon:yes stop_codon:yes gene_type:complete